MPRYPRFSSPIALGIATALASLTATAQESPAGLEEVVVTAQRVETDIQKTPVAVTALTGDFLRDYDFRQVTSIEGAAPNLNFAASTGGAWRTACPGATPNCTAILMNGTSCPAIRRVWFCAAAGVRQEFGAGKKFTRMDVFC